MLSGEAGVPPDWLHEASNDPKRADHQPCLYPKVFGKQNAGADSELEDVAKALEVLVD